MALFARSLLSKREQALAFLSRYLSFSSAPVSPLSLPSLFCHRFGPLSAASDAPFSSSRVTGYHTIPHLLRYGLSLDPPRFGYWIVTIYNAVDHIGRKQLGDVFVDRLAQVVGSQDKAMGRIYIFSRGNYYTPTFGVRLTNEEAIALKYLPMIQNVREDLRVGNDGYCFEGFRVTDDAKAKANHTKWRNDRLCDSVFKSDLFGWLKFFENDLYRKCVFRSMLNSVHRRDPPKPDTGGVMDPPFDLGKLHVHYQDMQNPRPQGNMPPPSMNRPSKEKLLPEDCKHWVVALERPRGFRTRAEIIDYFIEMLAPVVGRENVGVRLYSAATVHCYMFRFGVLLSTALSQKVKDLSAVTHVLADPRFKIEDFGCEPANFVEESLFASFETVLLCSDMQPVHNRGMQNLPPQGNMPPLPEALPEDKRFIFFVQKPKGFPNKFQILDCYVRILARVVGSEDQARGRIYTVTMRSYTFLAFGARLSQELCDKLKDLPEVLGALPDEVTDIKGRGYMEGDTFMDE